jgi:hypothetical protein
MPPGYPQMPGMMPPPTMPMPAVAPPPAPGATAHLAPAQTAPAAPKPAAPKPAAPAQPTPAAPVVSAAVPTDSAVAIATAIPDDAAHHHGEFGPAEVFHPEALHHIEPAKPQNAFVKMWKKVGGGSLTLSIFVHAGILLAMGLIVVAQKMQEKQVDFLPGGGTQQGAAASQDLQHKVQQKKRSSISKTTPMKKIVTTSVNADISLPEAPPDALDIPDASSMLGGGSMGSGGFGGAGAGGGFGKGIGMGGAKVYLVADWLTNALPVAIGFHSLEFVQTHAFTSPGRALTCLGVGRFTTPCPPWRRATVRQPLRSIQGRSGERPEPDTQHPRP